MLRILGNILWLIFGGFEMAVGWFLAGLIMFVTIIGIPWGRSCFEIGVLTLWPFGRMAVRRDLTGDEDLGTGALGLLGNIVWFVFGGWWLCIGHLLFGMLLCITLIGIPFGMQHFKLAKLSLMPIGKSIVDVDDA